MIIDCHIDTVFALRQQVRSFNVESDKGHVDLPRLKKGNVLAAFFAVFPSWSSYSIEEGVDHWFRLIENPDNELYQIKTVQDLTFTREKKQIGAILHLEGAGGLDSELIKLRNLYRLGLRSLGLSWSNQNRFATGVGVNEKRGLTAEGKALIEEIEHLGIILDVSHLNPKSFWDVVETANKPFIASHSNTKKVCDHQRNLTDEQITAIKDVNGTIGINFCKSFLKKDPKEISLDDIRAHIDHIVDLAGINHVSIGSDFDGASVPEVLKDIAYYPVLIKHLEEHGYTSNEIEKITHENIIRVFKAIWR